jgi:hypothetical protein
MIEFHNDHLIPQELCRLLYQAVPKKYHVPVRFHNRRRKDIYGDRGPYPAGTLRLKADKMPSHIDINLNPIYENSWGRSRFYVTAPSTAIWRTLLEVCLHEFGHVATSWVAHKISHRKYRYCYVAYRVVEELADEWMELRVTRILENDPRLGQPKYITGYLGARLAKWRAYASERKRGKDFSAYIKEMRCRKTSAQLTAGDVLGVLKIDTYLYINAYELLRRVSEGIGIDYLDNAGRQHKLCTWGDVPVLAELLATCSAELVRRKDLDTLDTVPSEPPIIASGGGSGDWITEADFEYISS